MSLLCVNALTIRAQHIDTLCAGSKGIRYSVDEHIGNVYFWSVSGGKIVSGFGTSSILVDWNKVPGNAEIIVSERNYTGCFSDPVKLSIYLKGKNFYTDYPPRVCNNDSVLIIASGGISYLWSDGVTDSIRKLKINSDTSLQVVISDSTCGIVVDTLPVNIKLFNKTATDFSVDASDVMINQQVRFNYKGNKYDRVMWEFQNTTIPNSSSHDIDVTFKDTGLVGVKLTSVNQYGCIDSTIKFLEIHSETLFIPNAFTPNDDGLNDFFQPSGLGIASFQLSIYNRWGECIYRGNEQDKGWDGKFKNIPVMQDNYSYYCEAVSLTGRKFYYAGPIALIR